MGVAALYHYGEHSWRFRVNSSDDIEISGVQNVTRSQVIEVMGGDIGRNIFFIPLAQRKAELERIPWVESASLMRFVPNRLRIEIHERTPVAFSRVGSRIMLIHAGGTLMDLPGGGKKKYSFPVILGMSPGEPLSTRAPRMKIYNELVSQLDSGGAHYSQDLSEVDLSDPDDVKVLANDPHGEVLVHLGSSNYLDRYKVYVAHVQEWRQQFNKLESVDLRYDRQIVVNPEMQGAAKTPPLSYSAARAAISAGVKPAALITHQAIDPKPVSPTASGSKATVKPAVIQKPGKAKHKKTTGKTTKAKRAAKAVARRGATPAAKANTQAAAATTASASSSTTNVASQAGKKPSPAIKTQDHP